MLDLPLRNVMAWAVQVMILGGIGLMLPMVLRLDVPRARVRYLRLVLVACLALPLVQPWMPLPTNALTSIQPAAVAGSGPTGPGGALNAADRSTAPGPRPSQSVMERIPRNAGSVAIIVFLMGLAARLAWLVLGFVSLSRLRRSSSPLEPRPDAVDQAARLVGADADFRVSSRVTRPLTFGLRRPVVLVPREFTSFDPAQQTAVAAHELIHVARRDWLRTLADEALLSVLWFHPALWWLVGQIHLGTEQLVDREVIRLTGARRPYLEALLRLAAAGPTRVLQPASAFLKNGHLSQRVALLVREASMSRIRLAASFLLVFAVLACSGWVVVEAFPLRAPATSEWLPPVDITPGVMSVMMSPVVALPPLVIASQSSGQATGQQTRPTIDPKAQQARPGLPPPPPPPPPPTSGSASALGPYDVRSFGQTVEGLKRRLSVEPANPEVHYTLAAYYWERAYRDSALSEVEKRGFITMGLSEIDQALQLKPKYMEALVYKNLLLRLEATLEKDPAARQALISQAEDFRAEAMRLKDAQSAWAAVPSNAVRIGGGIAPPKKIKDVRPVYPSAAKDAGVQGVVIIEALIAEDGKVQAARILRSIPQLDDAALDAVRQWEFTPTLLNGAAIPVVMTVTVNFTLAGSSGVAGGGVAGGVSVVPPPPPPPPAPLSGDAVRVGGNIRPPSKLVDMRAVYPAEAQQARIQGVVILEILIGKDGKVEKARLLRSIPLLDQAAVDAVLQWEFTPTEINGIPTKVIMTVTVNFTLA
jgi:TonB family protein